MTYLVFDTETSGLPLYGRPAADNSQPRLLQIGALLLSSRFEPMAEVNLLVNHAAPVDIHPKAAEAHGISAVDCLKFGVNRRTVFDLLTNLVSAADLLVAHNSKFDLFVWNCFCAQQGLPDTLHSKMGYCTMSAMTGRMKLPSKAGGYKWPRLEEAYAFVTGGQLSRAHDAMADVRACAKVLEYLMRDKIRLGGALENTTLPPLTRPQPQTPAPGPAPAPNDLPDFMLA